MNIYMPPTDRARFDRFFKDGVQAETQGNFAAAAQKFELAAGLDPKVAELQFRWGKSLLQLTNYAAAREHLQLACDDDALPFRADSRINAIIRNEHKKTSGDNLILFDAAAALATNLPSGLLGDETFYEHVHFNFDGSYQLGRAWAEQVAAMLPGEITRAAATNGWASQSACDLRLGLSDWNRELILKHMIGRLEQRPLSGQLDNSARVNDLEARVKELQSRINVAAVARVREDFLETLQITPDDYFLRENFALFLQSVGDEPGAITQCRQVHDLIPQDCVTDLQLGRSLEMQHQWAEAESLLREAVTIRPSLTQGWIELGNVLASQGKFEPALASYSQARQQQPQDFQTIFRIGMVLAKLNRHTEAIENYRAAIKLNPANWETHFELGGELDSANQLDEARNEFGEAARLNPNNPQTHFNYGVLLAKQGLLGEARREFEETIQLEPTYTQAQEYLAQIQAMKNRTP